jgi:hypothetical protein
VPSTVGVNDVVMRRASLKSAWIRGERGLRLPLGHAWARRAQCRDRWHVHHAGDADGGNRATVRCAVVSRRRSGARQTGDDGRIPTSPPIELASDDDGHDAEPDGHPHRQQERQQQDSDDVFEGGQHVRVAVVGVTRRTGPRRVPMVSGPVATVELDKSGNRDAMRGPADPIAQPAVVRPHSSQRNDRRPTSRLKRSSWPTIRQRNRVGPRPTVTSQSAEPAVASARLVDVTALAHAVGHLQPIGLGGSPHVSTAATESSQSRAASLLRAPQPSRAARDGRGRHKPPKLGRLTLRW